MSNPISNKLLKTALSSTAKEFGITVGVLKGMLKAMYRFEACVISNLDMEDDLLANGLLTFQGPSGLYYVEVRRSVLWQNAYKHNRISKSTYERGLVVMKKYIGDEQKSMDRNERKLKHLITNKYCKKHGKPGKFKKEGKSKES